MGGEGSGPFRSFKGGLLLNLGIDGGRRWAESRFQRVELLLQGLKLGSRIAHRGANTVPVGNGNSIGNQSRSVAFVATKPRHFSDGERLTRKAKRKTKDSQDT